MYADLIKVLSEHHKVYVISGQPIGPEFDPNSAFYKRNGIRYFPIWAGGESSVGSFPLDKESIAFDRKFMAALNKTPATIIPISEIICPKGTCHPFTPEGDPKYFDQGHFRASYVITEFEPLEKILRK